LLNDPHSPNLPGTYLIWHKNHPVLIPDCVAGRHEGLALSWCRFCVSQNPHIEAKVVEELDRLGLLATKERPQPREVKYEDLSKLTYLNLVIKVCHLCKL